MDSTFDGPLSLRAHTFVIDSCVLTSLSTVALRGALGGLDAERARYTLAHELAHVVGGNPFVVVANNQGGMAGAVKSALLDLLRLTSAVTPLDFPSSFIGLGPVRAPRTDRCQ